MKSLMVLTMTILLAACSTTATTNKTTTDSNSNQTLSLEQIAEKSQSTDSILNNEELNVPAYINNTSRNTSKDISGTKTSKNSTKKTTTR